MITDPSQVEGRQLVQRKHRSGGYEDIALSSHVALTQIRRIHPLQPSAGPVEWSTNLGPSSWATGAASTDPLYHARNSYRSLVNACQKTADNLLEGCCSAVNRTAVNGEGGSAWVTDECARAISPTRAPDAALA